MNKLDMVGELENTIRQLKVQMNTIKGVIKRLKKEVENENNIHV